MSELPDKFEIDEALRAEKKALRKQSIEDGKASREAMNAAEKFVEIHCSALPPVDPDAEQRVEGYINAINDPDNEMPIEGSD